MGLLPDLPCSETLVTSTAAVPHCDVPGVIALGERRDEVAAGIQQALDACADEMRCLGKELPTPTATASTVQAA